MIRIISNSLSLEYGEVSQYAIKATGTRAYTDGDTLKRNDASVLIDGTATGYDYNRRGITLTVLDKEGELVATPTNCDTYNDITTCATLIKALQTYHNADYVIVLTSYDAIGITAELETELENFGGNDSFTILDPTYNTRKARFAYVFIGQYGMKKGTAYFDHNTASDISMQASVTRGVLTPCGMRGQTVQIRTTEWATTNPDGSAINYKDGTTMEDGALYLDVVTVSDTTNKTFEEYVCRKSHTSSEDKKPSSTSEYWKKVNNVGPIRTPLLDAQYVIAQYLHSNTITAQIVETIDSTKTKKTTIKDGTVDTNSINAKGGTFEDVTIKGSIRSNIEKFSSSGTKITSDNFYIETEGDGWGKISGSITGEATDIGRTLKLLTRGSGSASFPLKSCVVYDETGKKYSSEFTIPGNCIVELFGIGKDGTFEYWQVINRSDLGSLNYVHGVKVPLLAYGCIKVNYSNGTWSLSAEGETFDGSSITVKRTAVGVYIMTLPSSWKFLTGSIHVMTTPCDTDYFPDGTKEPIWTSHIVARPNLSGTNKYIEFMCADDDSRNDQSFFFEIKAMGEMAQYNQNSSTNISITF